ncbi:MAG TPA: GNAT family N-acetyltransferase [Lachnospiraceae bacterium]|nr:GNAT family N-acetyltransferase [Lachnospiraceae bacterium]
MKYRIREVTENELTDVVKVIRQSHGTVAKEFGLTEENCPTNGAFLQVNRLIEEREKGDLMYGLFTYDDLVGFMQLEEKEPESYELKKLSVIPNYRHLGLGKNLIEYAKEVVRERRGRRVTIGIIEENYRLREWYLKNGFIHTGTKIFERLPFTVGFMEMDI